MKDVTCFEVGRILRLFFANLSERQVKAPKVYVPILGYCAIWCGGTESFPTGLSFGSPYRSRSANRPSDSRLRHTFQHVAPLEDHRWNWIRRVAGEEDLYERLFAALQVIAIGTINRNRGLCAVEAPAIGAALRDQRFVEVDADRTAIGRRSPDLIAAASRHRAYDRGQCVRKLCGRGRRVEVVGATCDSKIRQIPRLRTDADDVHLVASGCCGLDRCNRASQVRIRGVASTWRAVRFTIGRQ